jgi:hypothetical protein
MQAKASDTGFASKAVMRLVGLGAITAVAVALVQGSALRGAPGEDTDWASYHGNPGGDHFSP